jgi:hypothetical protein
MDDLLANRGDLRDWKHEVLRTVRGGLDRREFLKAAAFGAAALTHLPLLPAARGAASAPAAADAGGGDDDGPKAVKTGTFFFPRLMFHVKDDTGDQWNIYPVGDVILRKRLRQLTNINASQDPVVVRLSDLDTACRYPFVFATSEGYFDLPKAEEDNLREFLMRGGFVYADDCVLGKTGDRFFRDYVKMINRLFESQRLEMKRVPDDHEINHCYFDFPKGPPFLQGVDHGGFALFEKGTGRMMTYLTPGDLHCGWTSMWCSQAMSEACLRMGINIIIYYLMH